MPPTKETFESGTEEMIEHMIENAPAYSLAALIELRDKLHNKGLHSFELIDVIGPLNVAILNLEMILYNRKKV